MLSRVEILKGKEHPWGKVLIDGNEIKGATIVKFSYEAASHPIVTIEIVPGELVIDADAVIEFLVNAAPLGKGQRATAIAKLIDALGAFVDE